jgi:hypothetical protein
VNLHPGDKITIIVFRDIGTDVVFGAANIKASYLIKSKNGILPELEKTMEQIIKKLESESNKVIADN